MAEDDDLKINTLHRFEKQSPRLVLQEYSHCEVPAGCGGVVIRWYDPTGGAPAFIRIILLGARGEIWLDGQPLATSWVQLIPGPHVIAAQLRATEGQVIRIFTIGAAYDHDEDNDMIHRGGARWRLASTEPDGAWTAPPFADHAWDVPARATPELISSIPDNDRWPFDRAIERGQMVYELPAGASWIRVSFIAPEIPR